MLGEEFLFRGVLLPRMESVFGRWSWVANGVLFGLYHVHQPWGIPNSVLTGLLYTYPTYRYRSTWMSIILHSAQSVYFSFLVARGRVGAGLGPRRGAQHGALAEVRDLGSRTYLGDQCRAAPASARDPTSVRCEYRKVGRNGHAKTSWPVSPCRSRKEALDEP